MTVFNLIMIFKVNFWRCIINVWGGYRTFGWISLIKISLVEIWGWFLTVFNLIVIVRLIFESVLLTYGVVTECLVESVWWGLQSCRGKTRLIVGNTTFESLIVLAIRRISYPLWDLGSLLNLRMWEEVVGTKLWETG